MVKFLKLRYKLMPYIYSLEALFLIEAFDFREDVQSHNVDDQFMFGPALLVCPVTTAMYYGPESRKLHGVSKYRNVYLPVGDWYDYWTDERTEGGRTIKSKANLETMPLYVRAGSIVPLGTNIQYADEHPAGDIRLKVYPGKDAIFIFYEDEGDSYGYEEGAFVTIEIQWNEAYGLLAKPVNARSLTMVSHSQSGKTMSANPGNSDNFSMAKLFQKFGHVIISPQSPLYIPDEIRSKIDNAFSKILAYR
ncbi:DUF5110 domain-containing protein [Paenibacillus sp. V4I5]|uniref:DUF5110 domain-containing protein n=1 Tax=Paenibacillus sp. V4I5 TaxID=3042306 RepID=UPI0027906E3E|nr:DUF5110 domain-containing protein [Paenibacillus sp. V4I5]MDQ0914791.1 alpha-glucosidase (family GH31 glycosyl hydrolase) [Paenibacillus sp. V4I5]